MNRVQPIEIGGHRAYVVPAEIWNRVKHMVVAAEAAEDVADTARIATRGGGVRIPRAVAKAELAGATPLGAWREHKGMTLQALADAAGLSKAYVSQIESGKRAGTAATLKKLAVALGVPMAMLVA